MLAQLGNVLYWLGCVMALIIMAIDVLEWFEEGRTHSDGAIVFGIVAIGATIAWVIGRACRYVLAGK